MTPALPLCNPLDVFRHPDATADRIALRATAQLVRSAALLADAVVPHQSPRSPEVPS